MFRASGWFHPIRKNVFRDVYIYRNWLDPWNSKLYDEIFFDFFFLIQASDNNIFKNMNSDEIKVILFKSGKNRKKNENF